MKLIINGEARRVESANLDELLAELKQQGGALALAVNGTIVPRGQWPQTPLYDGDTIDLFSVIAGG
ncbi:sulfur carrier protein ThiS [Ferrimonas sediminicola]|uniref:Sulfur carrier protein ThiS n=1 Tax=Ferrimonas sediminicola TaxID=2569538 RepID=A0A4V5NVI0_9GAMM|nr:sulfur carrier protein ThiS [Ferrimonas sediminicola]TKB50583.1 sulfur carrier protein ThiS [Ferrimonas sediminicola]